MRKRFWTCSLLALMVLLSACVSGQTSRPLQLDGPVPPEQFLATATVIEKVVTLLPAGEQRAPAQPVEIPTTQEMDEKAQETAIANLRALIGAPQLELTFQALERSPNASNYPAALFVDALGNSYYISPDTLQPVEFTIVQTLQGAPGSLGSSQTPDELRAAAEQLAQTHSTRFSKVKSALTYTEGIKGENNFFRWELPGTDAGRMPVMLQIGLRQDGSLFSYINSLDFLP